MDHSLGGSKLRVVISPPQGKKLMYTICLAFLTSNNEAKYEIPIAGLRITLDMQASKTRVSIDS